MNRIVSFMASNRLLWSLWLTAGVPWMALSILLTLTVETVRHWYSMWHWTWKYDVRQYAEAFTEAHRLATRKNGMKAAAGGMVQRQYPDPFA